MRAALARRSSPATRRCHDRAARLPALRRDAGADAASISAPCRWRTVLLTREELARPEPRYPLHARVCDACLLVQVDAVVRREDIFGDYAYFSSYSAMLGRACPRFAAWRDAALRLGEQSLVVEIASNDGYLLKHFVAQRHSLPRHRAGRATSRRWRSTAGVPTEVCFLGSDDRRATSRARGLAADLLVANNVLAHVPDLNDFVAGLAALAEARRRALDRIPASAEPDRGGAVRHHLSRAFLLSLARPPSSACLPQARPGGLRCRAAADPWRLAAGVRGARGEPAAPRGPVPRRRAPCANAPRGLDSLSRLRRLRAAR